MAIKHEFSFEFGRVGIRGTVVTVKTFARKNFWRRWKLVDEYRAAYSGFNPFCGAEWTDPQGKRLPIQTECDINDAAQKEIDLRRRNGKG